MAFSQRKLFAGDKIKSARFINGAGETKDAYFMNEHPFTTDMKPILEWDTNAKLQAIYDQTGKYEKDAETGEIKELKQEGLCTTKK